MSALLPCPFCNCALLENTSQNDFYVRRYGTHYQHPASMCYLSDDEVSPSQVEAWNTRSAAAPSGGSVADEKAGGGILAAPGPELDTSK